MTTPTTPTTPTPAVTTPTFRHTEVLRTPRLMLRQIEAEDLADLLVVNSDDEVTRYVTYATWKDMDDARAWLTRMQAAQDTGNALQWAVVDVASNTAIGACLLFQYDAGSARAELGYVLGRPWWGRGLMREALVGLLECAYTTLALRRVEAEVDPRNLASGALLRSLGFTAEGILRGRWVTKGRVCDVESFGLLKDDWLLSKEKLPPHYPRPASPI